MNAETLSGLIARLAVENGRVMLPQMGAFVVETAPASFSDKGFTLHPPYRKLIFRESQGDGTLLYDALSRQERISLMQAQAEVAAQVRQIIDELEEEGQAELPALGKFKKTVSGTILFVADEDLDVSGELMALDAVSLKTQVKAEPLSERKAPSGWETEDEPSPGADSAIEPEADSDIEPEPEPVPETGEVPEPACDDDSPRRMSPAGIIAICLAVLCLLTVALFYVGVFFFPDFLDRLLYTEEELELLRFFGL